MKNSRLALLFNRLNRTELRDLDKFLRSPYFNQREDVVLLYQYMVENKTLTGQLPNKRRAFGKAYPQQAYQDSKMRYLMSYLLELIREFLTQQELTAEPLNKKIHLCRALRRRGLDQPFEKTWKQTQQLLQQHPLRHPHSHYLHYLHYLERFKYNSRQRRVGEMHLQELTDELTIFYIADILRQSCIILSHQAMDQRDYRLKMLKPVLQTVEEENFDQVPAIGIYYHSYRALSELDNRHHFDILKQLIETHWEQFPPSEIRDIYLLAINYCIKRLNAGTHSYIREAFELYRSGLGKGIMLEEGWLSYFTYKNVLKLGLELKEFEWIEGYLDEYKKYLHPRDRENYYRYNMAVYYFSKPDYDQAMQLLQKIEFEDVLHQLDARRMLLRIYYERGAFDALDSLLDSFYAYIHRQRDIGYHKDNFLNLIRLLRKLLRSELSDLTVRADLRQLIEKTPALAERAWLLDQLH